MLRPLFVLVLLLGAPTVHAQHCDETLRRAEDLSNEDALRLLETQAAVCETAAFHLALGIRLHQAGRAVDALEQLRGPPLWMLDGAGVEAERAQVLAALSDVRATLGETRIAMDRLQESLAHAHSPALVAKKRVLDAQWQRDHPDDLPLGVGNLAVEVPDAPQGRAPCAPRGQSSHCSQSVLVGQGNHAVLDVAAEDAQGRRRELWHRIGRRYRRLVRFNEDDAAVTRLRYEDPTLVELNGVRHFRVTRRTIEETDDLVERGAIERYRRYRLTTTEHLVCALEDLNAPCLRVLTQRHSQGSDVQGDASPTFVPPQPASQVRWTGGRLQLRGPVAPPFLERGETLQTLVRFASTRDDRIEARTVQWYRRQQAAAAAGARDERDRRERARAQLEVQLLMLASEAPEAVADRFPESPHGVRTTVSAEGDLEAHVDFERDGTVDEEWTFGSSIVRTAGRRRERWTDEGWHAIGAASGRSACQPNSSRCHQ